MRRLPYFIIASVAAVYWLWAGLVEPAAVMAAPESEVCDMVRTWVRPEDKLYATFPPHFFLYYLRRRTIPQVDHEETIRKLLDSPEKIYCLTKDKSYEAFPETLKKRITVLEKQTLGHKTIYLLVNKVPPAS